MNKELTKCFGSLAIENAQRQRPLLEFNERGIYCALADVYVDPWKPVRHALITHGHADHARPGHKQYLCTHLSKPILRHRLGHHIPVQSVEYGEKVGIHGVNFSFHPAGHIIGSAQIRVEYKGEVWVVSGDYKTENDGLSTPLEIVPCHTFITESTFGLPIYHWQPQSVIFEEIHQWWNQCAKEGKVAVISGYSLGKAQRILNALENTGRPIFVHPAIENMHEILRMQGIPLQKGIAVEQYKPDLHQGALLLTTPGVQNTAWMQRFKDTSWATCSGWAAHQHGRKWSGPGKGFVLSDHADWHGLNSTIKATGCTNVLVTHGFAEPFARWLKDQGLNASPAKAGFIGELEPDDASDPAADLPVTI